MWSGWNDSLSGMDRYALEVFKLSHEGNILFERFPLKPDNITAYNETENGVFNMTYTPSFSSGMFSAILEAQDTANNSRYIRRFFLYDSDSTITKQTGINQRLFVSSASNVSDYTWQTNNITGPTTITLDWTDHYINQVHVSGGFLNAIQAYPPQLQDTSIDPNAPFKKQIDTKIVDNTVDRPASRIESINAIVK